MGFDMVDAVKELPLRKILNAEFSLLEVSLLEVSLLEVSLLEVSLAVARLEVFSRILRMSSARCALHDRGDPCFER